MTHPVFIHFGNPDTRDAETAEVQKRIRAFETEVGRPVTSQEILRIFGEVLEPNPTKRKHISSTRPIHPGKLWIPGL